MMLSRELFTVLRQHIALPEGISKMRVSLAVDAPVEIECTFVAQQEVIDVTPMQDGATRWTKGGLQPVTKRYKLVEDAPSFAPINPYGMTTSDMHGISGLHSPPVTTPIGVKA